MRERGGGEGLVGCSSTCWVCLLPFLLSVWLGRMGPYTFRIAFCVTLRRDRACFLPPEGRANFSPPQKQPEKRKQIYDGAESRAIHLRDQLTYSTTVVGFRLACSRGRRTRERRSVICLLVIQRPIASCDIYGRCGPWTPHPFRAINAFRSTRPSW